MYDTAVQHTNSSPITSEPRPLSTKVSGVRAVGLGKRFGDMWALRQLDLDVPTGSVLGLLGHNGAGKTTAIRMLTTLSLPSEGTATVAGFEVTSHPDDVRRRIGVASQAATVDPLLDAHLNIELVGRLNQMSRRDARRRADELLDRFGLSDSAHRLVKTFSGGMRRRLDLAASLVATPEVLFLDEPTTGLDPRSREDLWQMLRELVDEGTTLILTTQYLEEADRLADDIIVLDHGRTVAHGTPDELKAQIGGDRIEVTLPTAGELVAAAGVLSTFTTSEPSIDTDSATVSGPIASNLRIVDLVRALDDAGIDVTDVNRRRATLDDVFLSLTTPSRTSSGAATPSLSTPSGTGPISEGTTP
jgi:ABC-2 type transport system ATP-binding protein